MAEAWEQWVGHTVDGQFALLQYLGGSGHSAVFLTEYQDPEHRQAVIKVVPIHREKATQELSRAESAARLSHPHLLPLFRVGLCHLGQMSLLYFVMEHADEDLSQVIPQRPLSAGEALDILSPALEALTYLHSQGWVHGHLKPSNILAAGNRVKLSGDLLCRIGDSGDCPGNPGLYSSPSSAHEALSPAGDVWSLAMSLVEALTQRLEWPAILPGPFDDILPHCLQSNPRRRWTIDAISKRLNAAPAKPPQPHRQRLYYAVAALAFLLIAILAGAKLLTRRAEQPRVQQTPVLSEIAQPTVPQPTVVQPTKLVRALQPLHPAIPAKAPETAALPAGVVHRVLPAVPGKASSTIRGKLKMNLELNVDPSGSVLDAKLDPPVLSRYFGDLALQAARDWKFAPSGVDGPSKWILRFEFERTETKVYPERIAP